MSRAVSRLATADFIEPMKALGVNSVPDPRAGSWHCEIKFDGFRALAVLNRGHALCWSRNHKPLDYPEVVAGLEKLKCANAVLDGTFVRWRTRANGIG